jgi:hypothetical protein
MTLPIKTLDELMTPRRTRGRPRGAPRARTISCGRSGAPC